MRKTLDCAMLPAASPLGSTVDAERKVVTMLAAQSNRHLALTGDSLITRRISVYDVPPARALLDLLRGADVAFTNLETVPNNSQGYPIEEGGAHLGEHDWVLDELAAAGFNLFGWPNNRSLTDAITAQLALIDVLDRGWLACSGVGRNLTEARMPVYLDTAAGSGALGVLRLDIRSGSTGKHPTWKVDRV